MCLPANSSKSSGVKSAEQPPAAAVAHRTLADADPGEATAADHAAGRLGGDLAVGQCLLEFGDACVGDSP